MAAQKGDPRAIPVPRESNPRNQQARVDRLKARMALTGWRFTHADLGDGGRPVTLHFENLGRSRFWWLGIVAGVFGMVAFAVVAVLVISFVSWKIHQPDGEPGPALTQAEREAALTDLRQALAEQQLARYVTGVEYDPKLSRQVPEAVNFKVNTAWEGLPKRARFTLARKLWQVWWRQNPQQTDPDRIRIRLVNAAGRDVGGSRWLGGAVVDVD